MPRPPVTTHAEIEAAAFRLFARDGFDATTIQDIADELGVGRRTVLRYFPSKNDIPWGPFDDNLEHLRAVLAAMPPTLTIARAVHTAILDFNALDPSVVDQHRERMALILGTPALQAHSALRYEQWRAVIADYVGTRLGVPAGDLTPRLAGHVALGMALSAYEIWLADPDADLTVLLAGTVGALDELLRTV